MTCMFRRVWCDVSYTKRVVDKDKTLVGLPTAHFT